MALMVYADKFKKRYRKTFTENQVIRIPKRDNLGTDAKTDKGRFKNVRKIMYKCEPDSCVVRTQNGRFLKKRHFDLKGIHKVSKGETPVWRRGCRFGTPIK
ncbi:hypothetical protein NGRA_3412 [Nosema granulosis]|uniref:Uncharacterized protein n=1 Tax=Nosema granulosis TaxID=83296 RepID=A0A9P6GVV2_9MICR|nr:hypothetical protein NGRA_3412 [Nosema granulosis]